MESHIRVATRLRPLTPKELREGSQETVYAYPETKSVSLGRGQQEKQFFYDYAFPPSMSNTEVYETSVSPLVAEALKGYNVTILAYGQVRQRSATSSHDGSRETRECADS